MTDQPSTSTNDKPTPKQYIELYNLRLLLIVLHWLKKGSLPNFNEIEKVPKYEMVFER